MIKTENKKKTRKMSEKMKNFMQKNIDTK